MIMGWFSLVFKMFAFTIIVTGILHLKNKTHFLSTFCWFGEGAHVVVEYNFCDNAYICRYDLVFMYLLSCMTMIYWLRPGYRYS